MNRLTPIPARRFPPVPCAQPAGVASSPPLEAAPANPFARPDLWQAFRFTGYFQRETVAVFARSVDAESFCLANIGTGNGFYVGEYRREATHG